MKAAVVRYLQIGVAVAILSLSALEGSTAVGNRVDSKYLHTSWQYEEGLPQNIVQAVTQTRDGYIWVGTQRGLSRFDGLRFTNFDASNTPEIKNFNCNVLYETKDGSLWIGMEEGLYRLKDGKFSQFSTVDGLVGNQIRSILEDRNGTIWVGTVTGLSLYKNGKFSAFDAAGWRKNTVIKAICEDKEGAIWLGTTPTGLFRWKDGVLTSFDSDTVGELWGRDKAIPNDTIRAVCQDGKGNLWVGGNGGLTLFREKDCITFTKADGLADSIISTIFEDREGNLWIGSYGGLSSMAVADVEGLLKSHSRSEPQQWFRTERSAPADMVSSICQDREGNIWYGSKDALSRLKPRRFISYTREDGLAHNNVTSVYEDKNGVMWMGTWGGGLNRLKDGVFTNFTSTLVLALHEDNGNLWFGQDYESGLFQFDMEEETWKQWGRQDGAVDNALRVIHRDRNKDMWIGTTTALVLFRDGKFTRFTTKEGLAGNIVRAICEDHAGNLWFGTSGGLSRRASDGTFVNFTTKEGLSHNMVTGLYEDAEHDLWIATLGGGMNRYRDGSFTSYTTKDGLFQDEIFEIIEDDFGNLWTTSRYGVSRVNKQELDDYDRGKTKKIVSVAYGKYDGMVSLNCSAIAKPSAWKARDGRLWFATGRGLTVIDPKQNLRINEIPPPVIIERVLHDRSPVDSGTQKVKLPPGKGEMEFHYVALSFTASTRNQYKYKLEGADTEWRDAGSRREATYSKLSPGKYKFRVIASNNDGVWNETGAAFEFHLQPHFYQTYWFWGACVLGISATGFGGYRFRIKTLQGHQRKLELLVAERTTNLQAEIAQRQQVQAEKEAVHQQLLEISRKAGMAEVASGVLHNVGNALNSVNVSATLVYDKIQHSRLDNLDKVAALLSEHSGNLPEFFNSEKGKQVPPYINMLANHLALERKANSEEISALRKNVDHIKDIISMQQEYAKVSGVVQWLQVTVLVDEALQMNSASLAKHEVRVIKNYTVQAEIGLEKHKVYQILTNLIRNAKQACDDSGRKDKQLKITTERYGEDSVQISVEDNGVGIPQENLMRIFSHGFTTRHEGHGFGLHSAALTAKDMGGSLSATSAGRGSGATFILRLPLLPKQAPTTS